MRTIDYRRTFKRSEKKYLLSCEQRREVENFFAALTEPDEYAHSTVCSLYCDTADNELIRRSLEHPPYKEKLRLRSYCVPLPDDTVYIELKKKYGGIVYKRRTSMTDREARQYLADGVYNGEKSQILCEIDYFIRRLHPQPSLYTAYDRTSYRGIADSEFRVTFDENIRFRRDRLELSAGDGGSLLLPRGCCLMEIKAPDAMPLEAAHFLAEAKIFPVSFSKYGNIYTIESQQRSILQNV